MSTLPELAQLIATWRGPLIGLLTTRGLSREAAIELAQDTFAEAWVHRARFRGPDDDTAAVGRWLAGIARNLHRQRARIRPLRPLEEAVVDGLAAPEDASALDRERASALHEAIESLPARERVVVHTSYFEETSTAHVAALLETSPRAVEGLLRRARKRLEEALSRRAIAVE